jgi:serine/threonine protein kinase
VVSKFVAGQDLRASLKQGRPPSAKAAALVVQVAEALHHAHRRGLVHRDVKPANILLETSVDRVMLTDFGLARAVDDATLTRTGIIAGTPQYMSPEQANGDAVDHRSDLFSLGSVLYAMCTGRPPFRAETTFGVLRRIRETSPRPIREINADVPDWLEAVVLKLLSKEAAERVGSATEVAALLEQCLAHLQQPTTVALPEAVAGWTRRAAAPEPQPIASVPSGRRPVRWVVGSCVVLAAIALGVFWPPAKPTVTNNPAAGSPNEPSTLDPQLEWEAMQTGLDESAATIDALEAMSQQELDDLETKSTPPADSRGKDEP